MNTETLKPVTEKSNNIYNDYNDIMKVRDVKVTHDGVVRYKVRKIGTARNFCCGYYFRLTKRKMTLFSILKVKSIEDLSDSIEALLSIKIPPRKNLHLNFSLEIAKDKNKLSNYEEKLNSL